MSETLQLVVVTISTISFCSRGIAHEILLSYLKLVKILKYSIKIVVCTLKLTACLW